MDLCQVADDGRWLGQLNENAIFEIIHNMSRWFNIGGACNPAKHCVFSAVVWLPEVVSLVRKELYFSSTCRDSAARRFMLLDVNCKGVAAQ